VEHVKCTGEVQQVVSLGLAGLVWRMGATTGRYSSDARLTFGSNIFLCQFDYVGLLGKAAPLAW
jgi:hypothetical protein